MKKDLMFKLIKSQLTGENIELTNNLNQADLKELYTLSKAHDICHIVAAQLEKQGLLPEGEIKNAFIKQKMLAIYRREQLDFEEEKVCALLEQEGIDYLPLKGSVIKSLYPEKWMRTSSDTDILVKESNCEKAIKAITEKLGYEYLGNSLHDHQLKSQNGVHLELHFSVKGNGVRLDKALEKIWDHATRIEGSRKFELTNEFLLFHIIAHAQYHFTAGGCGIKPFLDMFVINQKLGYDKEKLYSLLAEGGSVKFFESFCRLTEVWFNGGEHDEITEMMEEYILSGGVYGTVENYGGAQAHRKGGRLKYVCNRIFKPKKELEAQFPNLKNKPLLLPFYQIKRWFGLWNQSKRKTVLIEVEGSGNNEKISKMLKKLDL